VPHQIFLKYSEYSRENLSFHVLFAAYPHGNGKNSYEKGLPQNSNLSRFLKMTLQKSCRNLTLLRNSCNFRYRFWETLGLSQPIIIISS
jgi:hypothetical protein